MHFCSPTEGAVYVEDMSTQDEDKLWDIRQNAGMIFQNPDNQIIGTVVQEDVGFGPENLGYLPTKSGSVSVMHLRQSE